MLDLKFIRENTDTIKDAVKKRNAVVDIDKIINLDEKRRVLIQQADELKAQRNAASQEIGRAKKHGEPAADAIEQMRVVSDKIKKMDDSLRQIETEINEMLSWIPNIPHKSVPAGGEEKNEIIRSWREIPEFDFSVKPHWQIGLDLKLFDFDRGARLSGSNFITMTGKGARLQRALINFMLDLHTEKHGYKEVNVPYLVRREILYGTAQLPKLADDMYVIEQDDMFLIPTAEVPVTNLHREEMLSADILPIKYTAYTPCFRREAGSYGADTKGLMRIHQFDKVEMVKIVKPENSYTELENLLSDAEEVLQLLNLPYRVLNLAAGDISFAAAKCYDIEVWAPGANRYLEVSSCSNDEDFQARRMNMRFRREKGAKPEYVHTLNGSGLALPRTVIAIVENYQTADGKIKVPDALQDYMGCSIID